MQDDAERRDEKSAAEAERGGEHRPARAALFDPAAEDRRGGAEEEDRDREYPAESVSFQSSGADLAMPISLVIGRLKTLKA